MPTADSWLAGACAALGELEDLAGTPKNRAFISDLKTRLGAVAQAAPALKAAGALARTSRTAPAAWKSSNPQVLAAALLSAPVRCHGGDYDRRFEVATEESGHVVAALSLGYRVKSAHATKDSGFVDIEPTPRDPRESCAILVAGPAARDAHAVQRATAGGWDGLRRILSAGDWALLTASVDPRNPDSLAIIRNGAILGMGQVAVHRGAVEKVRDALMRRDSLTGAEIAALLAGHL